MDVFQPVSGGLGLGQQRDLFRRDAKAAGLPICRTGSSRKCEDGIGDRETSRRVKGYGMFPGRHNDRSGARTGRTRVPQRSI